MELGVTTIATTKIHMLVDDTLRIAAEVLKGLEKVQLEEQPSLHEKKKKIEHKAVSVTSCSMSSVTTDHQPPPVIRTPNDAYKNRKLYFPNATIHQTRPVHTPQVMSTDLGTLDTFPPTPAEDFPKAGYFPSKTDSKIQIHDVPRSREGSSERTASVKSAQRKWVTKLAVEPLEDIKHLKCRGLKKPEPDSLFPMATYAPGTGKNRVAFSPTSTGTLTAPTSRSSSRSSSDSASLSTMGSSSEYTSRTTTSDASSLVYQPMEFYSKNGQLKMLLQPAETTKESKKETPILSKPSPKDAAEFPIVPKQLESSHKLKIQRTKFSTKIAIGGTIIDLSGICSGGELKKEEVTKIFVNGITYSI